MFPVRSTLIVLPVFALLGSAPLAGQMLHSGRHVLNTPAREVTPADVARGDSLRATVRAILERYPTPEDAERAGYRWFLRRPKEPRVYHYTNRQNAKQARTHFDARQPTALLYKKDASGTLRAVGVMYTAPPSATADELDARVPVSLGQWHQHVKLCLPRQGTNADEADMMGPNARFGPLGKIDTKEACEAAGGRFVPRMFGWMVHVELDHTEGHRH